MKIDYDRFREVLQYLNDNEASLGRNLVIHGIDAREVNLYLGIQRDEGLIDANEFSDKESGTFYYPTGITFKGLEFLSGSSDPVIWDKAKRSVRYGTTIIGIVQIIQYFLESSGGA